MPLNQRHPNRAISFRAEDLNCQEHPLKCFKLQKHDIIQRMCDAFCKKHNISLFNLFIMPFEERDIMLISREGTALWGLPAWSIVMSSGSLRMHRGWNQAANFAHEFGHAINYSSDDVDADAKAAELIGHDKMIRWLNDMIVIHGPSQEGARYTLAQRLEKLQHALPEDGRMAT